MLPPVFVTSVKASVVIGEGDTPAKPKMVVEPVVVVSVLPPVVSAAVKASVVMATKLEEFWLAEPLEADAEARGEVAVPDVAVDPADERASLEIVSLHRACLFHGRDHSLLQYFRPNAMTSCASFELGQDSLEQSRIP